MRGARACVCGVFFFLFFFFFCFFFWGGGGGGGGQKENYGVHVLVQRLCESADDKRKLLGLPRNFVINLSEHDWWNPVTVVFYQVQYNNEGLKYGKSVIEDNIKC